MFRRAAAIPAAGILSSAASTGCGGEIDHGPKNIIFMVADGMSPGVLALAELFSEVVRGTGTVWCELQKNRDAATGLFDQASLNSCVTDSSAASSSWGSGVRISNGAVNTLPDGEKLTPIATIAQDLGKRVGLVTTTTLTHATPAGFAAVHEKRGAEAEIATQYMANVDVLLGGGLEFFSPALRKDGRNLIGDYEAAGFLFVRNHAELQPVGGTRKLLGIFSKGQIPYTIDRRNAGDRSIPTLAECTHAALASLESDKGFLLQVEGGRVDHAAHASDAAAMLWEQLDFDDAVGVAIDYARRTADTLVVLCSDHGNSNPGMNGIAKGFRGNVGNLLSLSNAKSSFSELSSRLKQALLDAPAAKRPAEVRHEIEDCHGIGLSDKEATMIAATVAGEKGQTINQQFDTLNGVLGQVLSNHRGIGWVGKGHTTDYTISTAFGPGAAAFNGLVRNTRVFELLTGFMGSEYRNPSMTPDEAQALISEARFDEDIHWV